MQSKNWPRFCAQMRPSPVLTVSGFNKIDGVSDGI
jgi:hypothetical protein